jgi:hypothetical protein
MADFKTYTPAYITGYDNYNRLVSRRHADVDEARKDYQARIKSGEYYFLKFVAQGMVLGEWRKPEPQPDNSTCRELAVAIDTHMKHLDPDQAGEIKRTYAKTFSIVTLTLEGMVTPTKAARQRLLDLLASVKYEHEKRLAVHCQ